jgi:Domain of unknown function (DUF4259)
VGTFGTGPFSNDGALDLLDGLADQPAARRRQTLERIFSQARDHPDLLCRTFFPDEIVAAAALVAASSPGGENIRSELAGRGYDVPAVLIPAPDHELTASALQALLLAAGRDGPWHEGWDNPESAAQARQTSDQVTAILLLEQRSQDQELPFEH